jgi:hypothetical protein
LSFQSHLLSVANADGNAHIDIAPIRQCHAPRAAARGFLETHRDVERVVFTAPRLRAPPTPAEQIGEYILRAESFRAARSAAGEGVFETAGSLPPAAPAEAERIAFEAAALPGVEAARISLLVDLAAIEFRALVLVAKDIVGAADLLELFRGGFVAAMFVGMVLLGERAKGFLDLGLARFFGNTQYAVRICHVLSCRAPPESRPVPNIGSLSGEC